MLHKRYFNQVSRNRDIDFALTYYPNIFKNESEKNRIILHILPVTKYIE